MSGRIARLVALLALLAGPGCGESAPPLLDAMAVARPKLCPYLHLPVQSGSSKVLHLMRRGYDREGYLEKIAAPRAAGEMMDRIDQLLGSRT